MLMVPSTNTTKSNNNQTKTNSTTKPDNSQIQPNNNQVQSNFNTTKTLSSCNPISKQRYLDQIAIARAYIAKYE